jgi:hypothetical protein
MLGKAGKLGILTRSRKDLSIACRDCTATLALERTRYDRRPTRLGSGADEFVHEVDQLVRETHRDLLAHPMMVPSW